MVLTGQKARNLPFLESTGGRFAPRVSAWRRVSLLQGQEPFCGGRLCGVGIVARDLPDFLNRLPSVSNTSLYFHFLEARLRLERTTNDFSFWLSGMGQEALAEEIDSLNPYAMTLDRLRQRIIELGMKHLKH